MPLRGRTILIVEDSDLVRGLIKELLGAADVRILEASSGAEAIAVAANEQGADLLITDLSLPGGSGIELAQLLRRQWPGLKTLLISGDPGGAILARTVPDAAFLEKTYLVEELIPSIRRLLDLS